MSEPNHQQPDIEFRAGTIVAAVWPCPGSKRIISMVTQFISLWVDGHQPVKRAIAALRMHVVTVGELLFESGMPVKTVMTELERRGFKLRVPASSLAASDRPNPYFGAVHAVAFESGDWQGGADPRRDGSVARAGRVEPGQSDIFERTTGGGDSVSRPFAVTPLTASTYVVRTFVILQRNGYRLPQHSSGSALLRCL